MPELRVDVSGSDAVRRMLDAIGHKLAHRAMARTIEELEDYIAGEAGQHHKNGALVRSLETKRLTPMDWIIAHRAQHAPHAIFVHDGTKPHAIWPRGASIDAQRSQGNKIQKGKQQILKFTIGNRIVFSRQVNHPGYKGDKWMERAADMAPRIFEKYVSEYINNVRK